MSQTAITFAFEQWKAKEAVNGSRVVLDEFVFANVPGLDAGKPIDRKEGMPPAGQIVHRQAVNKTGVVNNNAVVYSVTLGTGVGDFDFNWIGLVSKASNTLAMIVHAPTQRKVANHAGQQGNAITRSFVMEYDGAASETAITTPAETWQIDFTARLGGIDEMQRQINRDHYGAGAFFGNGFLVARAGAQYFVTAGIGYVGGLRAALAANQNVTVTAKPVRVWADVSLQGNVVSQWAAAVKFTIAATAEDYTDNAGFKHYVFAVASIDAAGNITDLRPKGSLSDRAGNDAYLRKDDNLASLKDKAKSRMNLGLGTAATRNVGVEGGNVMEVGANGLCGAGWQSADETDADLMKSLRARGSGFFRSNSKKTSIPTWGSGFYSRVGDVGTLIAINPFSGQAVAMAATDGDIDSPKVNALYGTANKPSALDVDAVSASQGGEFKKEIRATGGVMVANGWNAMPGGIFPGNGDAASYEKCNVDIKSWYGIGFYNTCVTGGVQGRSAFLNVRTGDFSSKGRITGAQVFDSGGRVYSPDNKPTAGDVGALTDKQAALKYALRSVRVNGQSLAADVNLAASDVNAWDKTQADGRFVKQAGDVMTGPLMLPRLQFRDVAALDGDADLKRPDGFMLETINGESKNYPLGLGTLISFKASNLRNVQFAVGSGNAEFWLRSMRYDNAATAKSWARVYTTDYKPTAADVKAADMANNFAGKMGADRTISGDAKPATPGVWNVAASTWAPEAWGTLLYTTNLDSLRTDTGNGNFHHYFFLSHRQRLYLATNVNGSWSGWKLQIDARGGSFTGEINSTVDNFRLVGGDYGSYWRNDGSHLYLLLTNPKDQYGSWNALRPFSVEVKSGNVELGHDVTVKGKGTARYHSTPEGVPEGSGAYEAQLDSKAPYYQENFVWNASEGARYVPLIKGRSFRKDQGYPTAVSFGYLLNKEKGFACPGIHARGDNNRDALWRFDPNDRQLYAPGNIRAGDAVLHTDGNISGGIWGGYLSNWLNQNINGRVDWTSYNRDMSGRATYDYVNNRTHWWTDGERGWWKDENTGFIYQWAVGPWRKQDEQIDVVSFPLRFPNQCCIVNVGTQSQGDGNRNDATALVYEWNQDNCKVQMNVPGENAWWNPMRAVIYAIGR